MATPETSWSEILIAAGMEPELAKAFDLIELRTPDARAVTELTVALLNVRSDVEQLKTELVSVLERMTNLEEAESALVHLLGEQIVELRKMQAHIDNRFDKLTGQVDLLNGVIGGNRKAIERLDASMEVLHAKVRAVDKKVEAVVDTQHAQGIAIDALRGEVTEIRAEVTEMRGEVTETRGEMSEVLAWVRTQHDSE